MDDDEAALARCVGDVEAFALGAWGCRPMVRRGAGPFTDLLDVDAVESLLLNTARRPTFRLVRDGTPVPPGNYTRPVRLAGTTVGDAADVGGIAAEVAGGATLVMQGLQRTWLPLARFCRRLERATSHPVQANAYLTPAGARGLRRHADTHDVLVLQVEGTKGWEVDGLGDLELHAGDVLYLPVGTAHAAHAQHQASLHITVGLLRVTYRQVAERVLAAVGSLDRPLPLGFAHPERQAALAEALAVAFADAAGELAAVDPAAVAPAEARRARRRRAPLWTGQLRSVLATTDLDDKTRLRCRPDNPAVLHDGREGRVGLELVDRTLDLPAHTRAALEALLAGGPLAVGDLPGLTEPGRAVLARRLVREGLLEVVADDA